MMRSKSDVVIAAEDAQFGLSEVNWGILPAGNVSRALAETMRTRDALYYIMTGELFDGRKATEMSRTVCINPGSEYSEGILRGALVNIAGGKLLSFQFVSG
jgi:enoyl-CoA hydratase/carnithine racemase